jgi:SAM-dependent methyltransferase
VFNESQAATLVQSDTDHWWFANKAALVSDALAAHLDVGVGGVMMDVGAGAGGVTAALGWPSDSKVAVEGLFSALAEGRHRHGLTGVAALGDRLPFPGGVAQVVTLLDVIEHLADPMPALSEVRRILRPDGALVVTVPAHQWLWSDADEFLGHHRRYNRSSLRRELVQSGFEVVALTHIFSWLVLPVYLRRRARSRADDQLGLGANGPLVSRLGTWLSNIERPVVTRASLPVGTSVMAVARPARPT